MGFKKETKREEAGSIQLRSSPGLFVSFCVVLYQVFVNKGLEMWTGTCVG